MPKAALSPAPPEFIARLKQHGLQTPQELETALNAVGHTHIAHLEAGGDPAADQPAPKTESTEARLDRAAADMFKPGQGGGDIAGESGDIIATNPIATPDASATPATPDAAPSPASWQGYTPPNSSIGLNPYEASKMRMNTAAGDVPEAPNLKMPDYSGEQAATAKVGEAQAAQNEQVGGMQQDQAGQFARLVQTQQQTEREAQDKITYAMDIARKDPRNEWSGFKHVTAGIAAVLGGMGGAFTGGGNAGIDVLNKQIDRQVNLNKDYVAHLEQQYGDAHQANLAARLAFRDNAITQIESLKNTTQSPIIKANADLAVKQLQVKQQADTNAIHQNIFLDKMEKAKVETEQGKFMLQYGQGLMQRTVMDKGRPVIAPDEASAKEGRDFVAAQERVTNSANELLALAQKGRAMPATQRSAKMEQLTSTIQDDWRQLQHSGVFKESELKFIKGIADNPGEFMQLNPEASKAKLRELSVLMERSKQAKFSTWPGYQGQASGGQAAQYMRKVGDNG